MDAGRARRRALSTWDKRRLHWAAALAEHAPFGVKTTEAPHYLRVIATRRRVARLASPTVDGIIEATHAARPDAIGRARRAATDGNGFVFIDHVGQICPSGFLPLPVGTRTRICHVGRIRSSARSRPSAGAAAGCE